ncbi:hypothetical protein SETIT_5G289100v2 [Setaria italica]|uniref:Uncharacterized protein n=2 Tax=Setaria TaxID=4554 RepID=A0A368RBL7_SETIT|nr:hypothetical protein SETIT_5G289100v2 [Setaria italica]TKW16313.1 hypothetical protein SEVIR_5G292400v2 [Setaria viridis]
MQTSIKGRCIWRVWPAGARMGGASQATLVRKPIRPLGSLCLVCWRFGLRTTWIHLTWRGNANQWRRGGAALDDLWWIVKRG